MTAEEMEAEMDRAKRGLRACDCGSNVVMRYEPGCTFVFCLAENVSKTALPDWQPTELKRQWNTRSS